MIGGWIRRVGALGMALLAPQLWAEGPFSPPILMNPLAAGASNADAHICAAPAAVPGVWVSFWVGECPTYGGNLYRSRSIDRGRTWSPPVLVAPTNINGCRIARDSTGVMVAVWHDLSNVGNVMFSRSTDNGLTWSAPANLVSNTVAQYWPHIGTNGQGRYICVWHNHGDGAGGGDYDPYFSISTNYGQTWSAPSILNASFTTDQGTIFGTNDQPGDPVWGGGNVWIIPITSQFGGTLSGNSPYFMGFSRSTDNGATWSPLTLMNPETMNYSAAFPTAATNGAGEWVAVSSGYSNGTFDGDIFAAQSTDNGATWASMEINSLSATDGAVTDFYPSIAVDNTGRWVTTWSSGNDLNGTAGADIDMVMSQTFNPSAGWTYPRLFNQAMTHDADDDNDYGYSLAVDSQRDWIAGYQRIAVVGTDRDIILSHSAPNIVLSADNIDFGPLDIDAPAGRASLMVTNDGLDMLNFSALNLLGAQAGDFTAVPQAPLTTLGIDATAEINLTFDPSAAGARTASLEFVSNDPDESPTYALLLGLGTVAPEIGVSPPFLHFARSINDGPTASQDIVILNTGNGPLHRTASLQVTGADASAFQIVSTPPATIAAGGFGVIQVVFDPSSEGAKSASIDIQTDDTDEPSIVIGLLGDAYLTSASQQWNLWE